MLKPLAAIAAVAVVAALAAGQPSQDAAPGAAEPKEDLVYVVLETSMGGQPLGEIMLELNRGKAPISVENFLGYVDRGDYDGTIFHRVIDGFMIQGGGFTPDMKKRPTQKPIKNEWQNGLKNKRGTIAMARIGGNPDSASNQFFINVVDNPALDRPQADGAAYAVFGRVVSGMEVVDRIKGVKTTTRAGHQDVPVEPVVITDARRATPEETEALASNEGEPGR